jgi:lipoyl-dependent peroxiredoxin subunit D
MDALTRASGTGAVEPAAPGRAGSASLDELRGALPDFARDLRLNLGSVLTPEGAPGLSERQIWAVALASAIAARQPAFTRAVEAAARVHLDEAHLSAARTAAAIMGMNNVYYRFLHLVEDAEYQRLPARLRMNALGSPSIDRRDFELLALAVSAINACGMCITSHERKLREQGVGREAIQSAVRIAAVVHAVAGVLDYTAG